MKIQYLINHWTVTSSFSTVEDIRKIHKSKGWRDIGYHRIILHPESEEFKGKPARTWSDLVKTGRSLDEDLFIEQNEVGAHTLYYNRNSVGIAVVGHLAYNLHPMQREAIIMTNLTLGKRYGLKLGGKVNGKPVMGGHRDFNATQCPGNEVYTVVDDLRKVV